MQQPDAAVARAGIEAGGYSVETIFHPFLIGKQLEGSEELWPQERDRLSQAIRLTADVGGRSIYISTGGHGALTWEQSADLFSAAIAPCVAEAKAAGVQLMIENTPQLNAHIHIAHSLRDAVTLAEMAGIDVCMDLYGCWSEAGLHETIKRAMPRCGLIQVSDFVYGDRSVPARAVPGDGAIPLARILDWALSAGYNGGFDLELLGPRIDQEGHLEATRRAGEKLGEVLTSLGA
jgi:sugar phosphate isomerase/epimerase